MRKKHTPAGPQDARAIARWEGEGGARQSSSKEERPSRDTRVGTRRGPARQVRRPAPKSRST